MNCFHCIKPTHDGKRRSINKGQSLVANERQREYSRVLAKVAPDGSVTYKYVSETGYLNQGNGPLGDFIP